METRLGVESQDKKRKKKTEEREKMAMIAKKLKPEGLSLCWLYVNYAYFKNKI